jgi:hypothetical protein
MIATVNILDLIDAEEEVVLVEFQLPNRLAIDKLNAVGADLAEYVRDNPDGTNTIAAFVTPNERILFESMGFPAGVTIEDRSTSIRLRRAQARPGLASNPITPPKASSRRWSLLRATMACWKLRCAMHLIPNLPWRPSSQMAEHRKTPSAPPSSM